jgi:hypothetical protein
MLQIDAADWRGTLADYDQIIAGVADAAGALDIDSRLAALTEAFARHSPHAAPTPEKDRRDQCPACLQNSVKPLLARRPGPLVYGRCAQCGHGVLLSKPDGIETTYAGKGYYTQRSATGVGYDCYEDERSYREQKAEGLLERVEATARATGLSLRRLLEVGSGFGFTRAVAERRRISTRGVDLNPEAALATERIYGLSTFTGTLAEALSDSTSGVEPGAADAVVYQFVLEHVDDVLEELTWARTALCRSGLLVLTVPSMEAKELEVFGASYRSLRADHLHLFSRRSMTLVLERARFEPLVLESGASVDLLRGFLTEIELMRLYDSGLGADFLVLARKGK